MAWLIGLLGLGGYSILVLLIGMHLPMPPWARWFWNKIGWKTAA